ncbi:MAG: ATP-binding cassette domain-containing protein, partial [Saccharofermentans sp.]|nr:ATP-binding cassette domain-containing protein [Saccharofermentans sp.]
IMDRDIYSLSSGERQLIAIASSVTMHQKVLLFDEPSANLDYGNSMRLGSIISGLKKEGYTVLVADHRFFYLNGRIDKVLFMEDGKLRVFDSEEAFKNSGYNVRSFDLFSIDIPFRPSPDSSECIAEMKNVSYKNILHDVSLKLYRGEVVGIVGNNGVGKTTLAKLLCKTFKPDKGSISINDLPFFIMQDPDYQLFGTSVKNELSLVKDDDKEIEKCLSELGLLPYKDKHPFDLSGGQKQRLQIGMAMLCGKDLIIFDEPTSGLDVGSMKTVVGEILKLKSKSGILVISHDYEFLRNVADRIVFVSGGTVEKDFYLNSETVSELNNIFTKMQEEKTYEE